MRLRDDQETQTLISAILVDQYGERVRADLISDILNRFGSYEGAVVEGAIAEHMMNTQPDGQGQPVGRWPPTAADIAGQIRRLHQLRGARERARRQREMEQESDRTYIRAMRSGEWRAEIRRGKEVRDLLVTRHRLNPRKPEDMAVVMRTLKRVQRDNGLRDVTDEVALQAAAEVMEERRKTLGIESRRTVQMEAAA